MSTAVVVAFVATTTGLKPLIDVPIKTASPVVSGTHTVP